VKDGFFSPTDEDIYIFPNGFVMRETINCCQQE